MTDFDTTFISYSSKDKPAADATCAVLESAGIRCWIAPRDIRPGTEYGAAIIDAIDRCRVWPIFRLPDKYELSINLKTAKALGDHCASFAARSC
jgi:hypothetical protein